MLTPLDMENKKFSKQMMNGYNVEEVDDFLDELTEDYEKSHWSHSHIIPANRNIMAAFLKIKKWDKVTIEGELVDIEYTDRFNFTQKYKTSLSRTDNGTEGRGSGPAEIIYVTKVKIGNKVYK